MRLFEIYVPGNVEEFDEYWRVATLVSAFVVAVSVCKLIVLCCTILVLNLALPHNVKKTL